MNKIIETIHVAQGIIGTNNCTRMEFELTEIHHKNHLGDDEGNTEHAPLIGPFDSCLLPKLFTSSSPGIFPTPVLLTLFLYITFKISREGFSLSLMQSEAVLIE